MRVVKVLFFYVMNNLVQRFKGRNSGNCVKGGKHADVHKLSCCLQRFNGQVKENIKTCLHTTEHFFYEADLFQRNVVPSMFELGCSVQ